MAVPGFVNSTKGGGSTATVAITAPGSVVLGDLLSLWLHSDKTSTTATFTATGWIETFAAISSNPGAAGNTAQHFTRIADASDVSLSSGSGSYSFTRSGGSGQWGGILDHLTGVDPAAPVNAFARDVYLADKGTLPAVTTTVPDALILHYTTWDEGKTVINSPVGDTLSNTNILSSNAAGSSYRDAPSAGSIAATTWNLSAGTRTSGATVAYQPKASTGGTDTLTATGVATSAPNLGTPSLGQAHSLEATGVATGAPTATSPALALSGQLVATGISAGQPAFGPPVLAQQHLLSVQSLTSAVPVVGAAAISQTHAVVGQGVSVGTPTVGQPTLAEQAAGYALTALSINAGAATFGRPLLSTMQGVRALVALGIHIIPSLGTPRLNAHIVQWVVGPDPTPSWQPESTPENAWATVLGKATDWREADPPVTIIKA